jgi:type II secretory pathway component PulJ
MSRATSPFRRAVGRSDETGTTLVELLVSMSIMGVVLAAVFAVLTSVQKGFTTEEDRSVNATQVGLVMQQLGKEIQSAEAFSICSSSSCSATLAAGATCTSPTTSCDLVAYTQTNANTRQAASPGPNAPFSCVQWHVAQVASSPIQYAFQSRRWQPDWESNPSVLVTPWRSVSDPLATVTASFLVRSNTAFGGRLLRVTVALNRQPSTRTGTRPLSVTKEFMGANVLSTSTTSGAPNPCIPPTGTLPP